MTRTLMVSIILAAATVTLADAQTPAEPEPKGSVLKTGPLAADDTLAKTLKLGESAPSWQVKRWHGLPKGVTQLDVADYRGKVVVVFFFQSHCEGCIEGGVPLFAELRTAVKHDDVEFVAVQTVCEFAFLNTFDAAREFADEYEFDFPIGHTGPQTLREHRAFMTPWFVIVDRVGNLAFSSFFIAPQVAKEVVDRALAVPFEPVIDELPKPTRPPVGTKKPYWF
ncbi:MAG: redoxin domain-containing protein [Planctomycetota bacterium]